MILAGIFVAPLSAAAQILPSVSIPSAAPVTGLREQGLYVTAPVVLDGAPLFRIAALAKTTASGLPIDTRVLLVENALAQLLAVDPDRGVTVYDPKTLKVSVVRDGSQYALQATDAQHAAAVTIVTVTSNDARVYGLSEHDLAIQWEQALQPALVSSLQKREPANIRSNLYRVLRGAVALVAITLVLMLPLLWMRGRLRDLTRVVDERHESIQRDRNAAAGHPAEPTANQQRRTLALLMRAVGPEQRLRRLHLVRGFLVWTIVLLWAAAVTYALLLFPQTTAIGQFIVQAAGRIVFVWIVAGVVDRGLELTLMYVVDAYGRQGTTSEERARRVLRGPTITRAVGGFKTAVIFFIALLVSLSVLQIPIASVVTIGGIAALAIGFAAQSLVRDLLNGLLVLFEDQYVVGDYVMVGDYNGVVENLTLRIVQLRDMRGYVITIPHSAVSQVVNASRNWARLDYRIAVDPGADLKRALEVLRATLEEIGAEDDWRDAVLEPVEWLGVEEIRRDGIVLRSATRTAPLRQFELHRAVNERVLRAFEKAEIALGVDPLGVPTPAINASPNPL